MGNNLSPFSPPTFSLLLSLIFDPPKLGNVPLIFWLVFILCSKSCHNYSSFYCSISSVFGLAPSGLPYPWGTEETKGGRPGLEDPIHGSLQAGPCQGQGWAVPSSSSLKEVVQPHHRVVNVISLLLWHKSSWFILRSFGGTFWVPSGNFGQPSCQRLHLFCQLYRAFAYRVSEGGSSARGLTSPGPFDWPLMYRVFRKHPHSWASWGRELLSLCLGVVSGTRWHHHPHNSCLLRLYWTPTSRPWVNHWAIQGLSSNGTYEYWPDSIIVRSGLNKKMVFTPVELKGSLGAFLQLPHGLVVCPCPVSTFEMPSSPGTGLQALLVG